MTPFISFNLACTAKFLRIVLFVCSLMALFSGKLNAQTPNTMTLFDCIKKAREYHPFYSDKLRIDQNRQLRIKNISSTWLPQLNLSGQATYQSEATKITVPIPGVNISGTPLDQYKVALDVSQVLFDGGSVSAQKKLTHATVDAELKQNETDIYKVNEQVIQVYFYSLLLQVTRDLYKNTLEDLKSRELKISSGVRNGILLPGDLDNLKVEILKTVQLLNEIDLIYNNNLHVLSDLTGDSAVFVSKLAAPEMNIPVQDSIKRPEIEFFDIQKYVLEESKILSASQRMPKFYAFSQVGYGRPGLNMLKDDFQSYYIIGLKFQWNVWDWNKSSREKSIYSVQQEMVESKKDSYLRGLDINAKNELSRIRQLESALATDEEILSLRKNITLQTEKRLDQGMVTMTDYLNDFNAQIKAGLQLESHKIQLIQSKANYLTIKGLL